MLEGLGAETGDVAETAAQPAVPARPHGVGAILDDDEPVFPAHRHHRVHVRQMAAHVGQQQVARAAGDGLAFQVLDVDHVTVVDIDQHRLAAGMVDGARHRRQGKGVEQHLVARLDAGRLQGDEQRAAAGIDADAVFHAHIGGELFFQQRRLGQAVAVLAIAEQPAVAQQPQGRLDAGLGHRVGGAEVAVESHPSGDPFRFRATHHSMLPGCSSKSSSGKYFASRTSPVMACPSIPSRREMRDDTWATPRAASRVIRCQVSTLMNLPTFSPPE